MSDEQQKQQEHRRKCFPEDEWAALVAFARFLLWGRTTLKFLRAGTVFVGIIAATLIAWGTVSGSLKEALLRWLG